MRTANHQSLIPKPIPPTVTITLPLPPGKNSESRCHWATRNSDHRKWLHAGELAWMKAGRVRYGKCELTLHFYVRNIRDEDNLWSLAVKSILDSFKGRLFVDDSPEYLTLKVKQAIDRKKPRLEITAQPDCRAQEPQDAASTLSGVSLDVAAQESHCGGKNGGK